MTANDVIFGKWPKTGPAMLRSEFVLLCNILIYCPDLSTFRCFKCLSFISSLQLIRCYISCHFSRNVQLLCIWYTNTFFFFKVKFDLEGEVGDSNIGGVFRPLIPTSCITVPFDCPMSYKNFWEERVCEKLRIQQKFWVFSYLANFIFS